MGLKGTLQDLSLPDMVQLYCSRKRHARVRLSQRGREGILFFSDGELRYAKVGQTTGDEAVYELLKWKEGDFEVTEMPAVVNRENVNTPWFTLLLGGLQRLDEAQANGNGSTHIAQPATWDRAPNASADVDSEPPEELGKPSLSRRNLLIATAIILAVGLVATLALTISHLNHDLQNRVGSLTTQVAPLQQSSPTSPSPSPTEEQRTIANPSPLPTYESATMTPTPLVVVTATIAPSTPSPTPVIWRFQGYVFQWNGSRQNSTRGIEGMPVLLLENCTSTSPLAQTKTEQDGHFVIEYDASSSLIQTSKLCVKVPTGSLWNSPKPSQPASEWREVSPAAIQSTGALGSPQQTSGQNVFYFSIKRTFTGRVMDENNTGIAGARIVLRFLQGGAWVDILTAYTRSDGMFGLTHESSAANLAYYQIVSFDLTNYEHFDKSPYVVASDLWQQTQKSDSSQTVETIKPIDGTDFPITVTFYQRLKMYEYRPTQFVSLYADAKTTLVKATLLPNSSFRYKILGREGKRTHILVNVATDQIIPAKAGLVNPERPNDIKDATFGLARTPIDIVALDPDHTNCGWIDGYLDN